MSIIIIIIIIIIMHLRQLGHDFVLPNMKYEFNKRHFIARSLFDYVSYCTCLFQVYVYVFYDFTFCNTVVWLLSLCKHVALSCVFLNKLTYYRPVYKSQIHVFNMI